MRCQPSPFSHRSGFQLRKAVERRAQQHAAFITFPRVSLRPFTFEREIVMQSVLILTLGSIERTGWVNHDLALALIHAGRDPRFACTFGNVLDYRPHDHARNVAVAQARDIGVDWLIQVDNDCTPNCRLLDVIAHAPAAADVIGQRYAVRNSRESIFVFPQPTGARSAYEEVEALGGGVLAIRSTVWQTIPRGPWFTWNYKEGSETRECECGEDVSFCRLVRENRMKVYCHQQLAAHYHTVDLSAVACVIAKGQRQ